MPSNRPLDIYKAYYDTNPAENVDLYSVLLQISQQFTVGPVLYPGSYVHITPSLFFPRVVYVDSLSGIADMMADSTLQEYIAQNKLYPGRATSVAISRIITPSMPSRRKPLTCSFR